MRPEGTIWDGGLSWGQVRMVTNEMEAGARDQGGQAMEEFERYVRCAPCTSHQRLMGSPTNSGGTFMA